MTFQGIKDIHMESKTVKYGQEHIGEMLNFVLHLFYNN